MIKMANGKMVPFYKAPAQHDGEKVMCEPCDGYGRVPEEGSWSKTSTR